MGACLIGLALALLAQNEQAQNEQLSPQWRLFIITGFLGSLSTFSSFSAEVVAAFQQGRVAWAAATMGSHVLGSMALTFAGLATPASLRR